MAAGTSSEQTVAMIGFGLGDRVIVVGCVNNDRRVGVIDWLSVVRRCEPPTSQLARVRVDDGGKRPTVVVPVGDLVPVVP